MFILTLILIVVPGITLNWWLNKRERQKKQRGFEIKLDTGEPPVMKQKETNHG